MPIVFAPSPVSLHRDRTWRTSVPIVFAKSASGGPGTRKKDSTNAHQFQGRPNTSTNSLTPFRSSVATLTPRENNALGYPEDHGQGLTERTTAAQHVNQTYVGAPSVLPVGYEDVAHRSVDDGRADRGDSKRICAGFTSSRPLQRPVVLATAPCNDSALDVELNDADEQQETATDRDSKPPTYNIPDNVLRTAMLASRSSAAAFWSYKMYRGPNGEEVRLHYCTSKQTGETVAQQFATKKILGFDLEWRPNARESDGIKTNVSLIQLACEERIALFHLAVFKGTTAEEILPPTLRKIIESPQILKCGVAIRGDFSRIKTHLGVDGKGLFELSHLYNLVKSSASNRGPVTKRLTALSKQVEEFLQLPLDKGPVRTSDWSKKLDHQQTAYAATDAYASFRLYGALETKRLALDPVPDRPACAEEEKPILLPNVVEVQSEDKTPEEDTVEVTELESADEREASSESQDESDFALIASDSEDLSADNLRQRHIGGSNDAQRRDTKLPEFEIRLQPRPYTSDESSSEASGLDGRAQSAKEDALNQDTLWIKPPELIRAESWVIEWKSQKSSIAGGSFKAKANPSALRAYAMWYDQKLDVDHIASLMRAKPLQKSTVSTYIFDCILLEGLPYDDGRAKSLFDDIPWAVRGKYDSIRRRLIS